MFFAAALRPPHSRDWTQTERQVNSVLPLCFVIICMMDPVIKPIRFACLERALMARTSDPRSKLYATANTRTGHAGKKPSLFAC
jgi:hypothetical protein